MRSSTAAGPLAASPVGRPAPGRGFNPLGSASLPAVAIIVGSQGLPDAGRIDDVPDLINRVRRTGSAVQLPTCAAPGPAAFEVGNHGQQNPKGPSRSVSRLCKVRK
jgi:hypothetical protein